VEVPVRKPFVKLLPPLMDVAKPILDEPPLKNQPTCKAETMMEPKARVTGSTRKFQGCGLRELLEKRRRLFHKVIW
jgi:hypothetical protein